MAKETGGTHSIGALDLIAKEVSQPLFRTGQQRLRGRGRAENVDLLHGSFDLVIMNPPFTRPTNHEARASEVPVPSFAGFKTTGAEQRIMADSLKRIMRRRKSAYREAVKNDPRLPEIILAGHGNAGLASNFIDLAHAKVRNPGGTIALVLPASFLQGRSWGEARRLLETHYRDIVVVSIATTGSTERSFSADTGMAEVLVVATRGTSRQPEDRRTLFVNLSNRSRTILEAATVARAIRGIPADRLSGPVETGVGTAAGRYIRGILSGTGAGGLSEPDVASAVDGLVQGQLSLPDRLETLQIPLVSLEETGTRGFVHRDINGNWDKRTGHYRGPFCLEDIQAGNIPTYPALWGHDAGRERRMIVHPDKSARPREGYQNKAIEVWRNTATRLHFNLDFRLNSQPLAACMTPDLSIGGRAWPNFRCDDRRWETPLVLWSNTTLGMMAFWWIGNRQQQGRASITISKLPSLTVLDPRELSAAQLDGADAIFEEFRNRELLPANEAWRDETRKALDRAVLVDLVGLPEDILEPLALLRRQWCAEPSVHGGKLTMPPQQGERGGCW